MEKIWVGETIVDGKAMKEVNSCGVLLFRKIKEGEEFLLMKHPNRYDLPKGHREEGETELENATREVFEETGFATEDYTIVDGFRFEEFYFPIYKRFGKEKVKKKLVMFYGILHESASSKAVRLEEHKGYEWIKWNPPHSIQVKTIDSLLGAIEKFRSNK